MKQTREPTLATVDGQPINIATLDDAVAHATHAARYARGFSLFTLNLDHLVRLRHDAMFRAAYSRATFVTADGMPVARLAYRQNTKVARATGADLVRPLCREAARHGLPVLFFGASERTLQRASDRLRREFPGLIVAGLKAPPQGFDPHGPQADAYARMIIDSGARLCFIALGAPKQELFAERLLAHDESIGAVAIGAALDFIAGEKSRAPEWMQRAGLEWFWRLSTEPTRLAQRYASCAALYLGLIGRELFATLLRRRAS